MLRPKPAKEYVLPTHKLKDISAKIKQ